jgi:hypothetical protein
MEKLLSIPDAFEDASGNTMRHMDAFVFSKPFGVLSGTIWVEYRPRDYREYERKPNVFSIFLTFYPDSARRTPHDDSFLLSGVGRYCRSGDRTRYNVNLPPASSLGQLRSSIISTFPVSSYLESQPEGRRNLVSRPTNRRGNVLTDAVVFRVFRDSRRSTAYRSLSTMAYGLPFPTSFFRHA